MFPPTNGRNLLSSHSERVNDMDDTEVAIQVVSHNPGAGALPRDMFCVTNHQLYRLMAGDIALQVCQNLT